MPKLYVSKQYFSDMSYHLWNRGVGKKKIFLQDRDYWVFRRILKKTIERLEGSILLQGFALMENHFHLLIHQKNERDITLFMRIISSSYSAFYRKKYGHTGHLFEGPCKGIAVKNSDEFQRVQRYILKNPIESGLIAWKHVGTSLTK